MENLLALVDKIQQVSPLPIFANEVFIVQNAGIQHWLNMSLAKQRGICLNIDYALPAQYLWKLLRNIVHGGGELEQAPFSREALCWRIYQLLASKTVLTNSAFAQVNDYWLTDVNQIDGQNYSEHENLKRYQLACQVADLYEQYLIFRPDWIASWHNGQYIKQSTASDNFTKTEQWQALLWQLLIAEQSYNPLDLIEQAITKLEHSQHLLPKRLSFFGINAMAPMWLSFIHALSEHTEVHFFHLNPCFTYWGDILSEKQAIKALEQWTGDAQQLSESIGNPLLANLGQQGREFLALLQQFSHIDIDAFTDLAPADNSAQQNVLTKIQQDILQLKDARTTPQNNKDDSIVITSAHSTLREVQGVHDWLLHQFNNDRSLTPKDVVIMCPQVEQYAPYVNAVFAQGWQELDTHIPPLPCSIADRISKDADPLVAAFIELLGLPDSRFQVTQIISWLRIEAMQQKFSLNLEDIEKISLWIEQACIHWGLDQSHKQQLLTGAAHSAQFTWQYGLARLLEGFAFSSEPAIYHDKLLLPTVEGDDAILLGQLMLVIEQLQHFTQSLNQARTPLQWQQFLHGFLDELFVGRGEELSAIFQAIEHLLEYCQHASFSEKIPLAVVKAFLEQHFSQPDPGRQFMVGQVTFCSMLPMRSIPFKIIAILGLNDGEYPRQRQPLGFDLMSLSQSRLGDRSRRGDDRYLFLEALISARSSLYLSFQGRSIRNNAVKQPSIVLKELMDYLSAGYGWQLDEENPADIRQLAMQPYSEQNYQGDYASFDQNWLTLNQNMECHNQEQQSAANLSQLIADARANQAQQHLPVTVTVQQLLSFFQHPSRFFAQQVLSLYLAQQTQELKDDEPFSCDPLTSYSYKQNVLQALILARQTVRLNNDSVEESLSVVIQDMAQHARLSGEFPDLPHTTTLIDKLNDDSISLFESINDQVTDEIVSADITVTIELTDHPVFAPVVLNVSTRVNFAGEQLVHYRPSSGKSKDFVQQYLNLLLVQVWQQQNQENCALQLQPLLSVNSSHGYYFDTKNQQPTHFYYHAQSDALARLTALLEVYSQGQNQPMLLNGELAQKYYKAKRFEQSHFEQFWHDDYYSQAFGQDPYIAYFWPKCPEFSELLPELDKVYYPIFSDILQVKT